MNTKNIKMIILAIIFTISGLNLYGENGCGNGMTRKNKKSPCHLITSKDKKSGQVKKDSQRGLMIWMEFINATNAYITKPNQMTQQQLINTAQNIATIANNAVTAAQSAQPVVLTTLLSPAPLNQGSATLQPISSASGALPAQNMPLSAGSSSSSSSSSFQCGNIPSQCDDGSTAVCGDGTNIAEQLCDDGTPPDINGICDDGTQVPCNDGTNATCSDGTAPC